MSTQPQMLTFNDILTFNALIRPEHKAVTLHDETWTYGQLAEISQAIAARLEQAGVRQGDRVGLLLSNQPMFLGCLFAATRIGAIPVLINVHYGVDECLGILRDCQAKLLIVNDCDAADRLQEGMSEGSVPDLETLWTLADLPKTLSSTDQPPASPAISADDIALCIYTSGTTGSSKGVMLSYRGLIDNAQVTAELMAYSDRDVLLPALPLFSSAGVSLTLISLLSGTHIVLTERNNPEVILETIASQRVTVLDMVPSGLKLLMKFNRSAGYDTSSLRLVVVGGDVSPPAVGQMVLSELGCNFAIVYGLTETSPVISITRLDDSVEQKVSTVGAPITGVEVSIRTDSQALPSGEIGEICCRGPYVMPGYFRNPAATRQCIDSEGWFYSGDLGYLRDDGHLVIVGRKKDMICIGGHNVFPTEVESHLIQHPNIKEVAVIGMESTLLGHYLVAFVVPKTATLQVHEVQAYCQSLAAFKRPQMLVFSEHFPYTGSGKVNKRALRERYLES